MNKWHIMIAAFICLGLALLSAGCSPKDEENIEEGVERAGNSVQKAYDATTNTIKDVVDEVNGAVYR